MSRNNYSSASTSKDTFGSSVSASVSSAPSSRSSNSHNIALHPSVNNPVRSEKGDHTHYSGSLQDNRSSTEVSLIHSMNHSSSSSSSRPVHGPLPPSMDARDTSQHWPHSHPRSHYEPYPYSDPRSLPHNTSYRHEPIASTSTYPHMMSTPPLPLSATMAQHREGLPVSTHMQSPISLPPSSSSSSSSVSRPMPHSSMTIDVPSLAGRNTSTSMTMTAPHAYLPFQASSHRTTHFHPSQPSAMNQSLPPHPSHPSQPSVTTLSHTIQHHPQGVMTTTTTTTHASYIPHQVPPHNMRYNHTTSMHSNAGVPSDKRTYNLTVVQQPVRARMCGFGEKDRRPVDPPPVVQLTVLNEAGHPDQEMERSPFFVVHVTLRPAEDPRFALDIIQLDSSGSGNTSNANSMPTNSTQVPQPGSSSTRRSSSGATGNTRTTTTTRVMMGTLVSSPSVLKDDKGNTGCFFCFPDLSIRCEGEYRLRFTLVKMNDDEEEEDDGCSGHTVAEVYSEPFTVYSAKRFPGMTESTQLSKAFARQGLKIPIRNDVRKRQGDNQ